MWNESVAFVTLISRIIVDAQVAVDEQKKRKGNPFTAVSQHRDPVHGALFRRQIHRRDLRPMKAVGMGQFGEVSPAPLVRVQVNFTVRFPVYCRRRLSHSPHLGRNLTLTRTSGTAVS